jgi:nicotinate-nucleotide pyrophosphorylase (carboxylating)
MRILEKYAVNVGGGASHRFGLFDMYLVKENHIKAAGSIAAAVESIKAKKRDIPVEVEAKSYEQVKEACECGVDRILLDNMTLTHISKSVEIIQNHRQQMRFREGQKEEQAKPEIEASGGVTLENVKEIALTGVEYISVGALTHSFRSIDLSLLIEKVGPQATSSGA